MHCRIGDGMKHSKLQLQVLLKTIVALVEFTITRFSACTRSVWGLPSWSLALSKLCDQNSKGMQHCQGSFSAGSTYIALLVLKYLVQVWHPEDWVCNEEWTKKAGHDEGSQGLRNGQVWWLPVYESEVVTKVCGWKEEVGMSSMGLTILRLGRMGYQQVDLLKWHSAHCIVSSSEPNSNTYSEILHMSYHES